MKRQIATVDVNGRTIIVWVDTGKAGAVISHGRPQGYCPNGRRQLRGLGAER